ncbi:MAG TPA: DUF2336 domain-containing protein [Patescibacteria group bacterium]|nr:DUF2336 domain-containing protein [Patescibacteria group bacterium]
MSGLIAKLLGALRGSSVSDTAEATRLAQQELTYEGARELARHSDPKVRRVLASRQDMRPEILYYLAEDPDPEVRREIAGNRTTPAQADLRLAADTDPSVRGDLAQKIARLAPGLSADDQDRLRRMTYEALLLLARDQITRVRQILAEALKDVANAPPELVRQLAHDSELAVAGPILEHSPVLTDEDLMEIIQSCPAAGGLSAISRRSSIRPNLADAIARTDDSEAIAVLLANPSAQIREETLDMLLDRAPSHEVWHGPLVARPQLSARAATRLARFVAESLLRVLETRADLDPSTKAAVAAVVRRRVEEGGSDMQDFRRGENETPSASADSSEAPEDLALRMYQARRLEEPVIIAGLDANDIEFVVCSLAVRASVSPDLVRKVVGTQSAKGVTALAWQAGLSMAAAVHLQTKLAKISPADVLRPRPGTQVFPMTAEEMTWQLEFFGAMAGDGKPPPSLGPLTGPG